MDSRFAETLLTVVRLGSVAAAARHLGLTAAAVSQRIKAVEDDLQVTLFIRSGKTMQATEDCLRLIPALDAFVESATQIRHATREDSLAGELRIGAIGSMMRSIMPDALVAFQAAAPQVQTILTPGHSPELYEQVMAGQVDLAVLIAPPFELPKSLTATVLRREVLMLVAPKGYKGSNRRALTDLDYIRYDPMSWGGAKATQYIQDQDLSPKIFCTTDVLDAAAQMVRRGLGVALLPNWPGANQEMAGLKLRKVKGTEYARPIIILSPKVSPRARAVDMARDMIIAAADRWS